MQFGNELSFYMSFIVREMLQEHEKTSIFMGVGLQSVLFSWKSLKTIRLCVFWGSLFLITNKFLFFFDMFAVLG